MYGPCTFERLEWGSRCSLWLLALAGKALASPSTCAKAQQRHGASQRQDACGLKGCFPLATGIKLLFDVTKPSVGLRTSPPPAEGVEVIATNSTEASKWVGRNMRLVAPLGSTFFLEEGLRG